MSGILNPAQQVAAALAALTSADAPQREAANTWLSEFANTDAAWEAAVDLLDPAQTAELQFFGANMVLMKVRSGWQQLGAANQQHLYSVVRYHPCAETIEPKPMSISSRCFCGMPRRVTQP